MDELKPCPVCGSRDIYMYECITEGSFATGFAADGTEIRCEDCEFEISINEATIIPPYRSEREAQERANNISKQVIKFWNTIERN